MITEATIRALMAVRDGKPVVPSTRRRLLDLGLAADRAPGLVLTPAGEMALGAYRIGRRRWGAA